MLEIGLARGWIFCEKANFGMSPRMRIQNGLFLSLLIQPQWIDWRFSIRRIPTARLWPPTSLFCSGRSSLWEPWPGILTSIWRSLRAPARWDYLVSVEVSFINLFKINQQKLPGKRLDTPSYAVFFDLYNFLHCRYKLNKANVQGTWMSLIVLCHYYTIRLELTTHAIHFCNPIGFNWLNSQ